MPNESAPPSALSTTQSSFAFVLCLAFSLTGIWLADYMLMNHDMSGILTFAQEMLRGKRLYLDLFTSQFPLIIYLMMIPIEIHFITGISTPGAFLLFVFLLFQLCALFSWRIALRNRFVHLPIRGYVVLATFYCGLFFLPLEGQVFLSSFGQRENLFCALILPYLMLALNRIEGGTASRCESALAGILAAIGFGIKPHFILIFGLCEFFQVAAMRRFFFWHRIDAWIIAVLSIAYYSAMAIFLPDYFSLFPKFIENYRGYEDSWGRMIFHVIMDFCVPAFVVWRFRKTSAFRTLLFLLIVIAGCEVLYTIPKIVSFYHAIPVYFFSLILFSWAMHASRQVREGILLLPVFLVYVALLSTPPSPTYITARRDEILAEAQLLTPYKTVDFLGVDMRPFPLVTYAGAQWDMSLCYLEFLPTTYIRWSRTHEEPAYHALETMGENERFFYEKIIQDLQRLPDAIIVFESPNVYGNLNFNFLHYFMRDPRFRDVWAHYALVKRVPVKYNDFMKGAHSFDAIYARKS